MRDKIQLLAEFDLLTNNQFDYIRLSVVNFDIYHNLAEYVFLYPEQHHNEITQYKGAIVGHLSKLLSSQFETTIVLKPSHLDVDLLKLDILKICHKHKLLQSFVQAKDIEIIDKSGDKYTIVVSMPETVSDFVQQSTIRQNLQDYLYYNFTHTIEINFVAIATTSQQKQEMKDREDALQSTHTVKLENEMQDRTITVTNIRCHIGRPIDTDTVGYIVDNKTPCNEAILCGELKQYDKLVAKSTQKPYYKFVLQDPTGEIGGVLFSTKDTESMLPKLVVGDTILARGKIDNDRFGNSGVQFNPKDISYCDIPKDFSINRMIMQVPKYYTTIKPKPFVDNTQQAQELNFFDLNTQDNNTNKILDNLLDKDIVVFDIETTGLDEKQCTIIEIAAVKIRNGTIIETFDTLIDPQTEIPLNIVELTGITQDMTKGKPILDTVLPDFFKFCENATIVAHNIEFDFRFVSYYGAKQNIYFDNPRQDTLAIARQKVKGLKNYKLGTICSHFGIINNEAHRALADTVATAKLYLKLCEL
ncbi:MAG: exonuclease domain-containing protein [Firmicutes bacterium]|nr:exonuclease domain-containing protein [Bacillota bacterium]MCL1953907.1 exonuclease domain-containing protein [Bacillota bacterium]